MGPPVAAQPRSEAAARAHKPCGKEMSLAKILGFREARSCDTSEFPVRREYAGRAFGRGFAFQGFGVAASRKRDAHAADSARSASLPDYRHLINPTGRNACVEGRHPTVMVWTPPDGIDVPRWWC